MKYFYTQTNIGMAKYVVNYYDGNKKHPDGSDALDIRLFKNKRNFNGFVKSLRADGYAERA